MIDKFSTLRRLSQEKHLVIAPCKPMRQAITSTPGPAEFFLKTKLSHVTGMLGLNQTKEEKGRGIMRLNWIVLREDNFQTDRCLYVGQCLTLGRAFMLHALSPKTFLKKFSGERKKSEDETR